jgi:hypothetical protein
MKVYVIVEILHSHALGTVQELAQETLEMWRGTSQPHEEFAIRELEVKGKVEK